jgi:hypothetical protein
MNKLKLSSVDDEKPVKLTVILPAALYRDLGAYADILSRESGKAVEPTKLIAPMLEKFIAGDRGFRKARGAEHKTNSRRSKQSHESVPPTLSAQD